MTSLVAYSSSSDSEDDVPPEPPAKRTKLTPSSLPSLPANFHTLYATNVRTSTVDDPTLHAGRLRQTSHKEGIWPSHIYTEWHPDSVHALILTNVLNELKKKIGIELTSLLYSDLSVPLPLHISLSRTLSIPTAQREKVFDNVLKAIRDGGVRAFEVGLEGGLVWAPNYDGSRFFLAAKAKSVGARDNGDGNELNKLLWICNKTCVELGYNALYVEGEQVGQEIDRSDSFHFSLGWSLKKTVQSKHIDPSILNEVWKSSFADKVRDLKIPVTEVLFKIGNAIYAIKLAKHRTTQEK